MKMVHKTCLDNGLQTSLQVELLMIIAMQGMEKTCMA
jgi:hypothetical protein